MCGSESPWLTIRGQKVSPMPTAMTRYMALITHKRIGDISTSVMAVSPGSNDDLAGGLAPSGPPAGEALRQPHPHQPEEHKGEGREAEDEEDWRAAHRLRQDVLLAEEEGAGGDEQSRAHPPQMA